MGTENNTAGPDENTSEEMPTDDQGEKKELNDLTEKITQLENDKQFLRKTVFEGSRHEEKALKEKEEVEQRPTHSNAEIEKLHRSMNALIQ